MTNKQVAEAFAKGATKGKSDNMFIEGNKIYSYGKHFCIAERKKTYANDSKYGRILIGEDLVTKRKYSSTTSRHTSLVKNALKFYQEVETLDRGF